MKISGFSICRNGVKFDYPIVEVIRSALPIVDEFIVNVGQSDDGTVDLIQSIGSEKVRIIESFWDDSMKTDGLIFSVQTNIALSQCRGDWALYLQADEVLHEGDHEIIRKTLHDSLDSPEILGFTFRYLHFYGDYWSLNPWAYHRAVRVIRNNGSVLSCGDAVGFCLKKDGGYLQSRHPECVRPSGATVYHYGWVKPGTVLLEKFRYQIARHQGEQPGPDQARMLGKNTYEFEDYDIMKNFTGSHPTVMADRIATTPKLKVRRNRWLDPRLYKTILERGFRG